PVDSFFSDAKTNPENVPVTHPNPTRVDKGFLRLAPYPPNMAAPAMPVIMAAAKTTISILAIGVNRHFNYPNYFAMVPVGPEGVKAFSRGFFELAAAQKPKPQTVSLVAADAEFARTASDGARENAQALGFTIVYDKSYPPPTTDFIPVMRSIQASNADVVFAAAYPPDTVGIVRAANEIGLTPKMFGGTMVGVLATPIKLQLGPLMNGLVVQQIFLPTPALDFPGLQAMLEKYRAKAAGQQIDPFGYAFAPFGYAAGQVLAVAVEETGSLDHGRLAQHIHSHRFATVLGDIAFGKDGEWAQARTLFTQFQNVVPNDLEQFRVGAREVILWPERYRTGTMIYPYGEAKK